jgi:hypothetical protein
MSGKRIRLTDRRRQAVDGSIPYPGSVNQPERQFKEHAQYDNWVETINHPLPDMRHEWKREHTPEGRDDIGFGIPEPWGTQPTTASIQVAADKSVRAAVLLLGEKVAEEIIEEQARDFMLMGGEALDRTLGRFSSTQELYVAADEEEADEDEGEGKEAAAQVVAEDNGEEEDEGDGKEASTELAVTAENNPTTIPEQSAEQTGSQEGKQKGASFNADVQAKIAELKAEQEARAVNLEAYNQKVLEAAKKALAGDSEEEGDDEGEGKEAAQSAPAPAAGDINIPERVAGPNEMDIELTATMDSEIRPDANADAMLAGLFDDGVPAELPEPGLGREASAKQGITSLGGQPKVASAKAGGSADISSIWDSAPDVSEIFN